MNAANKKTFRLIMVILLTVGFSGACQAIEPQPTPTPTSLFGIASGDPEKIKFECPEDDILFSLWFSHYAEIDIAAGDGETFNLRFDNVPPSFFDFWIFKDGTVSNEGIFREVPIAYSGVANHPNSNDCPVQVFEGTWMMRGTISGTCKNDRVQIHIVEEWIDPVLESNCTGPVSPGEGIFSAPELDLTFDLNDPYPSDFAEVGPGGLFQASYAYHLWLAGYDLPIVPLVPEK